VLGQVTGLLTVAAVLAVSGRAGWWATGWLTKITPGTLGAVWNVSRREWRHLLIQAAVTAGVALVSFALWPSAWADWYHFLRDAPGSGSVLARTLVALVLVAVGGRRGWWWVVPVALVVSAPTIGVQILAYLCGLARLRPAVAETGAPGLAGRPGAHLAV